MDNTLNTALLVMDMQSSILGNIANPIPIIKNVSDTINKARNKKIPVIYVVVGFRQGIPEISPDNKFFSTAKQRFSSVSPEEWMRIHPDVPPQDGDIITVKRRISAFAGSDLEIVLRAQGIRHLILTGVSTGGVVLSTLREAADKDFKLTVLSDCCADADEEVHRVLTTKVFPRQADVLACNDWVKG